MNRRRCMFIIVYSYSYCLKKIADSVANCSKIPRAWVAKKKVIHISKSPTTEPARNFDCKGSCEDMEEKRPETDAHWSFSKIVNQLSIRYRQLSSTKRMERKNQSHINTHSYFLEMTG